MPDFTSSFWSWFIIAIVVGGMVWLLFLLLTTNDTIPADQVGKPTGHVWDENLEEYNNPLPRWWLWLFYITLVFGVIYLAIYPGLGSFSGYLNWSQKGQFENELAAANEKYSPLYDEFLKKDVVALASDDAAMKTGERLFVNYCSVCHGSDARGAKGFPNLRDDDWLYGGTPDAIKTTIVNGRMGVMPAWGAALGGEAGVSDMAEYVLKLAGRDADAAAAGRAEEKFGMFCASCHMADGTGNTAIGAPNLTNNIWLYGGSKRSIMETLNNGRNGVMQPHGEFLGEAKVHVLTAYVYSLTQ